MPELPEVETVRRGLNRVTQHQPIRGGQVLLTRTIAHPDSVEAFLQALTSAEILAWHRRGKYLLAELTRTGQPAGWLGVHLRMTGQLLWLDRSEAVSSHSRVRLFLGEQRELRFVDQRTFGRLWWVPPGTDPPTVMTGLQRLGPEPFEADFSPGYLSSQLARSQRPI